MLEWRRGALTSTPVSEHGVSLGVRLRIDFGPRSSIGPGKIALLERIDASGSLSQAARELGMSYRRAWLLLDDLNRALGEPVTTTSVGGSGGGGAHLTPFGRKLIAAYREVEHASYDAAAVRLAGLAKGARVLDAASGVSRPELRAAAPAINSIERRPLSRPLSPPNSARDSAPAAAPLAAVSCEPRHSQVRQVRQVREARKVGEEARKVRPAPGTRARAARRSSRAPTRADRRRD